MHGSLLDTNERFSDNDIIHEIICGGGVIVGGIFALALVGLGVGLISFLLVLSGFAIDAVIYAIDFIRSNVKTRIKRLIRTININKIKKHKIRGLQRSLKNSKSLGNEQEKSNNVVSQNENFKYGIPLILNSYAELLEGVDPLKRDGLVQELKEQLMEYLEIVDGNSISDRDLFVGTEDLQDRIVDLNLRILAARRSSSSDSRLREVKIVQDKLDSLTNPVNTGTGVPHIDFELLKSSETSDSSIIGSIQGVNYTASPSSGEVINTQTQSAHR